MSGQIGKLKEYFNKTIETECVFDGDLEDINFLNTFCKAGSFDNMHNMMGANMAMLNIEYENENAVMMIFGIPLNENSTNISMKNISEKVLGLIRKLESAFITLDYINCKIVKDDHYEYVTVIKKITQEEEDEII